VAWRDHLVLDGRPRCVVNAKWKYLYWPDGFAELYDRESDPHELHNRVNDPDLASVRDQMHATLQTGE
jgi:arylsulfatase A-like enzyme